MSESVLWLTVDSDDIRHRPRFFGHPTRSRHTLPPEFNAATPSPDLLKGMQGFTTWIKEKQDCPITLFIIGEQLLDDFFCNWVVELLDISKNITVGCHGWDHRSWSAWPKDRNSFSTNVVRAKKLIMSVVGDAWRPWFRAPAGYIAPWMAVVLKEQGFVLDTSINPSFLVRNKFGPQKNWKLVENAMCENNIIERPWLNSWLGPACGPALHIPGLAGVSRRLWLKKSSLSHATEKQLLAQKTNVVTLYWHLTDHARNNGKWTPPVK
ncbi:MAG: polysaccharide deacetylase family protein [Euryarchaeota archaeon]|nr:polysaccharide deacetylase family protein [Euryarchaeota archaeon]MBT4407072.1 polysaccharide deacetylase family protein [Euryarchaeota archaeon]